MTEQTFRYFVLSGSPGIGKTTAVRKACDILKEKQITVNGFYTEEIRSGGKRTGFDVVLTNGTRAPLARINSLNSTGGASVGQYVVDVKSFESCVLPVLRSHDEKSVLLIDEIGKMEMFSEGFKQVTAKLLKDKKSLILATIPIKTAKPFPLVEALRTHPDTILLMVDHENRNALPEKIVSYIIDAKKKGSHGAKHNEILTDVNPEVLVGANPTYGTPSYLPTMDRMGRMENIREVSPF